MGTCTTLDIDNLQLDCGENEFFRNHSYLFPPSEIEKLRLRHDAKHTETTDEYIGYTSSLKIVKDRLDLLGYSSKSVKQLYESRAQQANCHGTKTISYSLFHEIVTSASIHKLLSDRRLPYGYPEGISWMLKQNDSVDIDNDSIETFVYNLDPYIVLRLLAENSLNLACSVIWNFADILDCGYARIEDVSQMLPNREKVLLVTEGTSDSSIIKRTIKELRPDVADFFLFVDMEENYPFTGTGNLYRFCQGLASIGIQNNVLVVFDNDTEGTYNYKRCKELKNTANMRFCKLPEHSSFDEFLTVGPNGELLENINGKAVAIECFLDLSKATTPNRVRWTNYNKHLQQYHGALENKESLVEAFKKAELKGTNYDTSRLESLVDYIIEQAIELKSGTI